MSAKNSGSYKSLFLILCVSTILSGCSTANNESTTIITLKEAYQGKFLIGATMNNKMVANHNLATTQVVLQHFSTATMDNSFKWQPFNPKPNIYHLEGPKHFAQFAQKNSITPVGHVLFWHSQTPDWVFKDEHGNLLKREALLARMRERAKFMAHHFGDTIKIWDVVNEAIEDDGSLRRSLFNKIIGDDFIEQAFIIADEELPSDSVKIYNDYGMTRPGRVNTVVNMVNDFIARGVPIDAIGIQGHWSMTAPTLDEISENFTFLASTGLPLHITELDVDYLGRSQFFGANGANVDIKKRIATPENNPYPNGNFPASADKKLGDRYVEIFGEFLKHHKIIDRVTFWGVTDADSWLNSWPVSGRTNYPLLFNRDASPKKALQQIIDLGIAAKEH